MKIKPRNYPYPVITPFNSEVMNMYTTTVNIEENEMLNIFNFNVTFNLKNQTLEHLISTGKAKFALHIECVTTSQRLVFTSSQSQNTFEVPSSSLNQTVDLNYFILANETIENYENIEIDPYSKGFTFKLNKGDIMAIAQPDLVNIEKEEIVEINSIFEIIPTEDKNAKPLNIGLNNSKIGIYIPKSDFETLSLLHASQLPTIEATLIAMYYTPAITEALVHIKNMYELGEENELEDFSWYRSLIAKLHHMKIDILELSPTDIIGTAHTILDHPNRKAMLALKDLVEGEESDD